MPDYKFSFDEIPDYFLKQFMRFNMASQSFVKEGETVTLIRDGQMTLYHHPNDEAIVMGKFRAALSDEEKAYIFESYNVHIKLMVALNDRFSENADDKAPLPHIHDDASIYIVPMDQFEFYVPDRG